MAKAKNQAVEDQPLRNPRSVLKPECAPPGQQGTIPLKERRGGIVGGISRCPSAAYNGRLAAGEATSTRPLDREGASPMDESELTFGAWWRAGVIISSGWMIWAAV